MHYKGYKGFTLANLHKFIVKRPFLLLGEYTVLEGKVMSQIIIYAVPRKAKGGVGIMAPQIEKMWGHFLIWRAT